MSTELLDYISFRESTHLNYHRANTDAQDHWTLIPQAMKFVQQDLPTIVLNNSDNPKLLLELGVRQWTGYGAPQDKRGGAANWAVLASHREDVPLSLKAQAYSSLARAWFERANENGPGTLNIAYLRDAGRSANGAAALGLISPAVLMVASKIESAGFRRPEDNKFPEHSTEEFERLTDLWKVLDARTAEMAEGDSRREAKASKNLMSYFCAADHCWIMVAKKSTLKRCGGECPLAFKPSYCSKYCQKADRKHHRPYCRPDATESSVSVSLAESARVTTFERLPNPPEDASSGGLQTINVNIDGRTVQIATTPLGVQMMREMMDAYERRL